MNCIACREPMIVLEVDQVEIDHCLDCGGIWLDAGELELLLDDATEAVKAVEAASSGGKGKPGKRRCPICGKRMEVIRAGSEGKVELDRCRNLHGLWFDRGELRQVLKAFGEGKNERIIRLLDAMFQSSSETGKE